MKYKLTDGSTNDYQNPIEEILRIRGISDIYNFLHIDKSIIHDYNLLNNIKSAISCFTKHLNNNSNIHIIVDCDNDGYTSAAIMYNYIKLANPNIPIKYSLHEGKEHGISQDIIIPKDTNLLIVPDAGSNDIEQCKELFNLGIDVIILDHHLIESDIPNEYAIVINNQTSDYPNKNFSGAGIVYKFIKAIDEELWLNYADTFLDLVALGNIGDVMDTREFETRYYINLGLNQINNKFFQALIEKQSCSMKNTINIMNVAFYIVPLINAVIRCGTLEEKDLLFRAFIETSEIFKYKPRGAEEINELIYDKVARLCVNIRSKQAKMRDICVDELVNIIEEKQLYNNKIIVLNGTNNVPQSLTGLISMQISDKYKRPCLILRKKEADPDFYGGSARNYDKFAITNLKGFLSELNLFSELRGHENAHGVSINKQNINMMVKLTNEKLSDIILEDIYDVDFIIPFDSLENKLIINISGLKNIWGTGVKEGLIAIEDIEVLLTEISFIGKTKNTLKFCVDDVEFVKFFTDENDSIRQIKGDWNSSIKSIKLNVIGKCSVNEWQGRRTMQILIEDYNIL